MQLRGRSRQRNWPTIHFCFIFMSHLWAPTAPIAECYSLAIWAACRPNKSLIDIGLGMAIVNLFQKGIEKLGFYSEFYLYSWST